MHILKVVELRTLLDNVPLSPRLFDHEQLRCVRSYVLTYHFDGSRELLVALQEESLKLLQVQVSLIV